MNNRLPIHLTLLVLLFSFSFHRVYSQTQMGSDIDGEAAGDLSGFSVSLSSDGSTVAIGAWQNDGNGGSSGHVRIFKWNGSSWAQQGSDIDGEAAGDQSGLSVSLSSDGSTVAIGAPLNDGNGTNAGHVRIYTWNGSSWAQKGSDIDGEAGSDLSGWSVSLSSDGSTLAIGAIYNVGNGASSGHVRIFKWNGSSWAQQGSDIDGEAAGDQSGFSVSLSSDGSTVAIGAPFNDGNGGSSGHVRIFKWNGSSWAQQGSDIDGEAAVDQSGRSVSLSSDGSTVAIGANGNAGNGTYAGHVRIYTWNGTAWIQKGGDIDGEAAGDQSGYSVSLSSDGSTVAIGAPGNNGNGSNSGHVRIYTWNGSSWAQQGSDIDGEAIGDLSGFSVSLSSDGSTVAIGAILNDENGSASGHVRIYVWNGSSWAQQGSDIDGEAADDESGRSVSLSSDGSTVAIGAPTNAGNGTDAGHVRVYQLSSPCSTALNLYYRPSYYTQSGTNVSVQGGSDGSIRTLVLGGSGNYTYTWTGPSTASGANPTGLKAGNYYLHVVDDNGCEGTAGPWTLREPN